MTPVWPHGDPRDVVRAIVADPRFINATGKPPVGHSWLDDVRAWIERLLRVILHGLDHALGAGNALDAALGYGLMAAALGLLGYSTYVLVRWYGRRATLAPRRALATQTGSPAERSSAALHAAALSAARGGHYRDAAGLLFRAAVRALDEHGRVTYDPARTPGEYRRILRDPLFDAFAGDAVVALFAAAEPRGELFDRMRDAYDRFFKAPAC